MGRARNELGARFLGTVGNSGRLGADNSLLMLQYSYLFSQLFRRELRRKYKGSTLGVAWYLINPLLIFGAYTLMFGYVIKVQQLPDFAIFLMIGLMVWMFFQLSLLAAAESLIDQGALIRKARFPRQTIPAATVFVQMVTFGVILAVILPLSLALRDAFTPALLLLPVLIVLLFCFVLGCALIVSVLHAYFRDVAPTLTAILLPWFFLTPTFIRLDQLPYVEHHPAVRVLLDWVNPLVPFIDSMRSVLYDATSPSWGRLVYMFVAAFTALGLGTWVFRRMEGDLAVVV
jgi:ABC-type polysaccharide/polyol phosphate export permease